MADKDTYISRFNEFAAGPGAEAPSWVTDIRSEAIGRFADRGFPTTRDEAWRFTRFRPLLQHDFKLSSPPSPNGRPADELAELSFRDRGYHRLVFLNGHYAPHLSSVQTRQGFEVRSLREAMATDGDAIRGYIARHTDIENNPFTALNTAYLADGAFVHIGKTSRVERPIHLLFVSTAGNEPVMSQPRNLIVADEHAYAQIVESYVGTGGTYFTNAVSEVVVASNADIEHYKIQKESPAAYHVASLVAYMHGNARFRTYYVSMGGALVRNEVNTILDGENIDCRMDGLYIADGHQHIDNFTNIEHAKPHCESHELYKGILGGRAKGVFNGKIHVHPDAQKTDAKQSNGCMLLSDDAQINTNPQLEIYADDVKCTHGAFVGQIDEHAVFYLRSRGIRHTDARHMLVYAFANEVLERIKIEPLRNRLAADLFDWLSNAQKGS